MSDQDVKALALFFFFALLDDKLGISLASEAADLLNKKLKTKSTSFENSGVLLVQITRKVWNRHKQKLTKIHPSFSQNCGFIFPDQIDLIPWIEFQKFANEEELHAIIWFQILGLSEDDIARALNLTVGTIRFRIAKGLKRLGAIHIGGESSYV